MCFMKIINICWTSWIKSCPRAVMHIYTYHMRNDLPLITSSWCLSYRLEICLYRSTSLSLAKRHKHIIIRWQNIIGIEDTLLQGCTTMSLLWLVHIERQNSTYTVLRVYIFICLMSRILFLIIRTCIQSKKINVKKLILSGKPVH